MNGPLGDAGVEPSVDAYLRADLRDFRPYASARTQAPNRGRLLNANESPWPAGLGSEALNRYPDPQPAELRNALASLYGVSADALLIGRGSDEFIDLLVRATCRAGRDAIAIQPPTFGMYAVAARLQDARIVRLDSGSARFEAATLAKALATADGEAIRLVFLCSPNNPTGAQVDRDTLRRAAELTVGRALLVIDGAYAEFASDHGAAALDLARCFSHVAVLRTLSKAHALAAARIGSLIATPALIERLAGMLPPYPLPEPSVRAAMAALTPAAREATAARVRTLVASRNALARALPKLPAVVAICDSDANFLAVEFADVDAAERALSKAQITVRRFRDEPALASSLRISMGTAADHRALLDVLADLPGDSK